MFRNLFDHPAFLLILVVLVVVIFGAKRLPDAARSLGRSMRIFKTEVKEMKEQDKPASEAEVRPLEGRVVAGDQHAEPPAARASEEQLSDAEAAARYREAQRHSA